MRVVIHGRVGTTSLEKSELSPQHGENSALFESAREFDQESAAFGKTNCSSDDAYSLFKARYSKMQAPYLPDGQAKLSLQWKRLLLGLTVPEITRPPRFVPRNELQ